jgi:hypothetical protein
VSSPTTGILDNFNRANEGPPPSASYTGAISGNALTNAWVVTSNVAAGNRTGASTCWWNVSTFGPDMEGYFTVTTKVGSGAYCGVFLRLQSPGGAGWDGYTLYYNTDAGGANDDMEIYRADNGVETLLGASVTQEVATSDQFFANAVGTALKIHQNGTERVSRTDATYGSAGYIGLYMDDTTGRIDDFGGGTVVTASTVRMLASTGVGK